MLPSRQVGDDSPSHVNCSGQYSQKIKEEGKNTWMALCSRSHILAGAGGGNSLEGSAVLTEAAEHHLSCVAYLAKLLLLFFKPR